MSPAIDLSISLSLSLSSFSEFLSIERFSLLMFLSSLQRRRYVSVYDAVLKSEIEPTTRNLIRRSLLVRLRIFMRFNGEFIKYERTCKMFKVNIQRC